MRDTVGQAHARLGRRYHEGMGGLPPDLERLFSELTEQVGGIRPEALPEAYLRALREIEELPCNRDGQDKSWVVDGEQRWLAFLESSRLVD